MAGRTPRWKAAPGLARAMPPTRAALRRRQDRPNIYSSPSPALALSVVFSQPKQPSRQAAIDGGALAVGESGLGDDLGGREIADRERHVRTHHDSISADD